ncbi:MAG: triose-phosphate isomerase [Bdellovibrionales bacterium]
MKNKIFAANWKMFKTPDETRKYFSSFRELVAKTSADRQVLFFPPALCLEAALESTRGTSLQIGVQNCHAKGEGAFTGEISAQAAQKMGAQWVLLGHSERRTLFHETDAMVSEKLQFVQNLGMKVMLCIGETLDERQSQRTESILSGQLEKALAKARAQDLAIAYEPVWAIGTGVNASPEQAEQTHQFIVRWLEGRGFTGTPVLYGGSVKPENAKALIDQPHVSGFLVGGASLDPQSFSKIGGV